MTLREEFTSEYMESLKKLTLQLKGKTASAGGGRRKSNAKGQSVEFSDFRNYVAGDSIKHIDWKSYGRLDKLFIKLFMEERQANINIILDTSGSMGFGGKGLKAKLLCACLSYMFMLNMDRVNIYALGNTALLDLTSPKMITRAADYLDSAEYAGENSFAKQLKPLALRQGSCIIISDFFTPESKTELFKLLAYKKQKVFAVMLLDKSELAPETAEDITLEDCENQKTLPVVLDKTALKKYKEALEKHMAETANAVKRAQGYFFFADTDMSVIKIIKEITGR